MFSCCLPMQGQGRDVKKNGYPVCNAVRICAPHSVSSNVRLLNVKQTNYGGKLMPHCVTRYARIAGHVFRVASVGKLIPATTALPVIPRAIRA